MYTVTQIIKHRKSSVKSPSCLLIKHRLAVTSLLALSIPQLLMALFETKIHEIELDWTDSSLPQYFLAYQSETSYDVAGLIARIED